MRYCHSVLLERAAEKKWELHRQKGPDSHSECCQLLRESITVRIVKTSAYISRQRVQCLVQFRLVFGRLCTK